jgi:hypothetical protein
MKIFKAKIEAEEVLVCQYSLSIQFQSALDPVSKDYFKKIFKARNPNIKEFAHHYVPADTSGQIMGARMVAYKDGRIVIGKANNHAYLSYQPSQGNMAKMEAYYNPNKKNILFTGEDNDRSSKGFNQSSWKKIFSMLSLAKLIDESWIIKGCPPFCGEEENISFGELLLRGMDLESKEKTLKSREAETMVQNFMIKRAIQNKHDNPISFIYRYADNNIFSGISFSEWLKIQQY